MSQWAPEGRDAAVCKAPLVGTNSSLGRSQRARRPPPKRANSNPASLGNISGKRLLALRNRRSEETLGSSLPEDQTELLAYPDNQPVCQEKSEGTTRTSQPPVASTSLATGHNAIGDSSKNITYNPLSELRSKLENCTSAWLLLLSLPRMVMLAHIQHLIGEPKDSDNKKPTIQPNDYMDCLLSDIKTSMHDRGLHRLQLPDQEIGVTLYQGHVTGLTNLSRCGDASLEADTQYLHLAFGIQAKNIHVFYWWKKRRLKGELTTEVRKVTMNLAIRQDIPNKKPPKITEFEVTNIEGIQVSVQGLGRPFNWLGRKILQGLLRRHLKPILEREARHVIQQEIIYASENTTLLSLLGCSGFPSLFS